MPIPEPGIYKPSNLTAEQRQRETAALYGVSMPEFTHEEIERMRQVLQTHDAQQKPMNAFDLNNPPTERYRHQDYPKMLYSLERSTPEKIVFLVVTSEAQAKQALADGWSEEAPAFGEMPAENLSAANRAEVEQVEQQLEKARRGRPTNASKMAVA